MKSFVFVGVIGLIVLYFMNIAILKTPILNLEWSIHAGIRFCIGFTVLGVIYLYHQALNLKTAFYITTSIEVLDYLYDYFVEAYRFNFEIILHGMFMLSWGAVMGYLTARYIKLRAANHVEENN